MARRALVSRVGHPPGGLGEPLVTGNVIGTIDSVAEHIEIYRERWAARGHPPRDAVVGVGIAAAQN